jgi:hypothetical protein
LRNRNSDLGVSAATVFILVWVPDFLWYLFYRRWLFVMGGLFLALVVFVAVTLIVFWLWSRNRIDPRIEQLDREMWKSTLPPPRSHEERESPNRRSES